MCIIPPIIDIIVLIPYLTLYKHKMADTSVDIPTTTETVDDVTSSDDVAVANEVEAVAPVANEVEAVAPVANEVEAVAPVANEVEAVAEAEESVAEAPVADPPVMPTSDEPIEFIHVKSKDGDVIPIDKRYTRFSKFLSELIASAEANPDLINITSEPISLEEHPTRAINVAIDFMKWHFEIDSIVREKAPEYHGLPEDAPKGSEFHTEIITLGKFLGC
jgi:hypothetical protein